MKLDNRGNAHDQLGKFTSLTLVETDPAEVLGSPVDSDHECARCHKPTREVGELNGEGRCEACDLDSHCSNCGKPIDTLLWGGLCEPCLDSFEPDDIDPGYRRGRRRR